VEEGRLAVGIPPAETSCQAVGMASEVPTFYANSNDVNIAYRVVGSGKIDLLWYPGAPLLPMECVDDEPAYARFQERLASYCRIIQFDARGVGLSDPTPPSELPTLEQWVRDAIAVLDTVGCEKAALFAPRDATLQAVLFAAAHPDRVVRMVVVNGFARLRRDNEYLHGIPNDVLDRFLFSITEATSTPSTTSEDQFLSVAAPSVASDPSFRRWWLRAGRQGASPATARSILRVVYDADVRPLLSSVEAPTLIIHRRDNRNFRVGHGRFLAEHIPGARYVELPGSDCLFWVGDTNQMLDEIEEFLTGVRSGRSVERALATVLFTDIVRSTETLADVGDQQWRDVLDRHDRLIARQVERFGGRQVKKTGDGSLAVFDGPAQAVRCACAIRDAASEMSLQIRCGIHIGEVEKRGDDIAGMAVHIAARVEGLAQPQEILVSRTVVDLVVGSGLAFTDRGEHDLKGVPERWRLFSADG
jgi:class 3 adenylate cyclase